MFSFQIIISTGWRKIFWCNILSNLGILGYFGLRYTRRVNRRDVMYSLERYFKSASYVGGPILGTEDTAENNIMLMIDHKVLEVLVLIGCTFWWGKYRQFWSFIKYSLHPSLEHSEIVHPGPVISSGWLAVCRCDGWHFCVTAFIIARVGPWVVNTSGTFEKHQGLRGA